VWKYWLPNVTDACAVLTQVTTGVKNGGSDMHTTLEKNIVDSWRKDCESKGRTDCITGI
jgi:hypothetical protein